MIEFDLIVKGGEKGVGFQADPDVETMVVALNPALIVSLATNRKNDKYTDIVCGSMTITATEEYKYVLKRVKEYTDKILEYEKTTE